MRKQLLTAASLFCFAWAIAAPPIKEETRFEITTEVNELTGKEDTVEVQEIYTKYNPVDSAVYEIRSKGLKHYPNAKLDLNVYVMMKSIAGTKKIIGGNIAVDSILGYVPKSDGTAGWSKSSEQISTFAGANPSETIWKSDLSAFGIPSDTGLTAIKKSYYKYPSTNVVTVATYNTFGMEMPEDSTLYYSDGAEDTASVKYSYSDESSSFELKEKTTWKYGAKNSETIHYNYDAVTSKFVYSSKEVYTEVTDILNIDKSYSWDTDSKSWTLISIDSAFYDQTTGNQTEVIRYSLNSITDEMEYFGRSFYLDSYSYTTSSPVPTAPSNLMVMKSNLRTEAATSYSLTWKDNSYNETKFEIYRKLAGEPEFELIGKADPNETMYVDGTAEEGEDYVYSVIAVNGNFKSVLSNEAGSNPTGIVADVNNVLKVEVFPNPTTDKWFVQGLAGAKNVSLTTIEGQAISFGIQSDAIDASDLRNGTYILKVEDTNGVARTAKVFKK